MCTCMKIDQIYGLQKIDFHLFSIENLEQSFSFQYGSAQVLKSDQSRVRRTTSLLVHTHSPQWPGWSTVRSPRSAVPRGCESWKDLGGWCCGGREGEEPWSCYWHLPRSFQEVEIFCLLDRILQGFLSDFLQ